MNVLVDGHNLIGQMPGINLSDEDDEAKLVRHLRSYATANRKRSVIVVFDRGVYGHPQSLNGYGVTCHFARSPQDADTQLIRRINMITRPSEWRVITSDREVARAAKDRGIRVTSSAEFAKELLAPAKARVPGIEAGEKPRDVRLSQAEINEWLRVFGEEPEPFAGPDQTQATPKKGSEPKNTKKTVHRKRVRKR